jgi:hypothetical protein
MQIKYYLQKKIVIYFLAAGFTSVVAYCLGLYTGYYVTFPADLIRSTINKHARPTYFEVDKKVGETNDYGQLIKHPRNTFESCENFMNGSRQAKKTGVILIFGQSNAANSGEYMYTTKYPSQTKSFFNGTCTSLSSPIIGASGEEGNFTVGLADKLIEKKIFDKILIANISIGGSSIMRWSENGNLNKLFFDNLKRLEAIDIIIFHHGERDVEIGLTKDQYKNAFLSIKEQVTKTHHGAPIFLGISTICGQYQQPENQIHKGLKELVDNKKIYLGVNADNILNKMDRRERAGCHLSFLGQEKIINEYSKSIINYYSKDKYR